MPWQAARFRWYSCFGEMCAPGCWLGDRTLTVSHNKVLHVGCGGYAPEKLHLRFRGADWHEVRLDIDPDAKPDIVASMTDMAGVQTGSMNAVFSSDRKSVV